MKKIIITNIFFILLSLSPFVYCEENNDYKLTITSDKLITSIGYSHTNLEFIVKKEKKKVDFTNIFKNKELKDSELLSASSSYLSHFVKSNSFDLLTGSYNITRFNIPMNIFASFITTKTHDNVNHSNLFGKIKSLDTSTIFRYLTIEIYDDNGTTGYMMNFNL